MGSPMTSLHRSNSAQNASREEPLITARELQFNSLLLRENKTTIKANTLHPEFTSQCQSIILRLRMPRANRQLLIPTYCGCE